MGAIALDPAGLVSGSWDNSVKVWRLDKPDEPKATLQGHIDAVLCVAISPDGQLIASGGCDNTILVWDRATGKQLRALTGHQGGVLALAFSADGAWLVSGSEDATARLWEVASSGRHVLTLVGHSADVRSVAFAGPAGERIITGDADGHLRVWDRGGIGQRPELRTFRGHQGPVSSIAFGGAHTIVASGSWDRSIRIWDLSAGRTIRTLTGHTDAVTSVRFSPDGRTLASASKDSTVRLWDLGSGRSTVLRHGDPGASTKIRDVTFSADGSRIATGGDDGAIRFWAIADGRMVASIPHAHSRTINSLAARPGTTQLASGSDDGTLVLWDMDRLRKIGRPLYVPGNDKAVWQIAFTPDGKTVVSGGDDRKLHVWDVGRQVESEPPLSHQGSVWSVDIAPDGLHVATGASDSTVHLFRASGAGSAFAPREELIVRVADGPVWWVVFDHDPKSLLRLAIGSTDKTLRVLDMRRLETLFSDPHALELEAERENGLTITSDDPQTGVVPMSKMAFPFVQQAAVTLPPNVDIHPD